MNLKEAFKYQKFLDTLMAQYEEYSHTHHSLSESAAAAEICLCLIDEKENLCDAITETKWKLGVNLDGLMTTNRYRQKAIKVFSSQNTAVFLPSGKKDFIPDLIKQANRTSDQIELAILTANVQHTPKFQYGSSFESVVRDFQNNNIPKTDILCYN